MVNGRLREPQQRKLKQQQRKPYHMNPKPCVVTRPDTSKVINERSIEILYLNSMFGIFFPPRSQTVLGIVFQTSAF